MDIQVAQIADGNDEGDILISLRMAHTASEEHLQIFHTVEDDAFKDTLKLLGTIFGREERAAEIVAFIEEKAKTRRG